MRTHFLFSSVGLAVVMVLLPAILLSQQERSQRYSSSERPKGVPEATPGPGWLTCPRCQNEEHIQNAKTKYKIEAHAFSPRDLSGIWGNNGIPLDFKAVPSFTPYGAQMNEATQAEKTSLGLTASNSKDGMLYCDPLGYPRLITYNYGFQFIQTQDKVMQFFEWGHTWRDIWTDGRQLPTDPPLPRWLGYSVGRWEGDTFVVESNGFDDRSWIDQDRRGGMLRGMPHSDQMQVEERYRRTAYDALEVSVTITDPKVYTKPWTSRGEFDLRPGTELWEYFCVPSESASYNQRVTEPAAGAR